MKLQIANWLAACATLIFLVGCTDPAASLAEKKQPSDQEHGHSHDAAEEAGHAHAPGTHGGSITEIGRDSYHCEPVLEGDGKLKIFMLQSDESKILEVDQQTLTAYVKPDGASEQVEFQLTAAPTTDDTSGKTSVFEGTLPEPLRAGPIQVTIQNIKIAGERFRFNFELGTHVGAEMMPSKVSSNEAKELYLTAGGLYTAADIEANGKLTATEKFANFKAAHDMNPQPGDKICPVTATKANAQCTWIVGGKTYEFCCPPCVDEFVTWAKTQPDKIRSPEQYVKE